MSKYKQNQTSDQVKRRRFLKTTTSMSVISVSGCLKVIRSGSDSEKTTPTESSTPRPTDPKFQTSPFQDLPETPYSGIIAYSIGTGPVNVDIYSDYAVDECAQFWNHTKDQLRDYYTRDSGTGEDPKITMTLRHFPKPKNRWSMFLPCAAMEVGVQKGLLALGEFHHRLFEDYFPEYSIRDVEIAASMVDADPEAVIKAGKERRRNDVIKLNINEGEDRGIQDPLGITVDGEPVEENTGEAIEEAIERAL